MSDDAAAAGPETDGTAGAAAPVRLEPGDEAPGFALADSDGGRVSLAESLDADVVLYFYPAASTPGCTTEACDFRDSLGSLASAGYRVLGVSKDDPADNRAFAEAEHLTFPLLSDPDLAVHRAYGAWGPRTLYGRTVEGVRRSTFVIGRDGRVQHALYDVKATGHVARLRRQLGLD